MRDIVIEKQGTLPSGKYFVTFNTMGIRCGYVEVPERVFKVLNSEHLEKYKMIMGDSFTNMLSSARKLKYNNVFRSRADLYVDLLNVHGGVTYVGMLSDLSGLDKDVAVIGFDCGHMYDDIDNKAYMKYFPNNKNFFSVIKDSRKGKVRTIEYVEEQCKFLESQIQGKEGILARLEKVNKAKAWRERKRTKRTK